MIALALSPLIAYCAYRVIKDAHAKKEPPKPKLDVTDFARL